MVASHFLRGDGRKKPFEYGMFRRWKKGVTQHPEVRTQSPLPQRPFQSRPVNSIIMIMRVPLPPGVDGNSPAGRHNVRLSPSRVSTRVPCVALAQCRLAPIAVVGRVALLRGAQPYQPLTSLPCIALRLRSTGPKGISLRLSVTCECCANRAAIGR